MIQRKIHLMIFNRLLSLTILFNLFFLIGCRNDSASPPNLAPTDSLSPTEAAILSPSPTFTPILTKTVVPSPTVSSTAVLDNIPTPLPLLNDSKADDDSLGFNLLVVIEGEVQLKRESWTEYHPTSFGSIIQRGDRLRVPSGARAVILCDHLFLWPVPDGPAPVGVNNGCPRGLAPPLRDDPGDLSNPRVVTSILPYIISPRNTKLLSRTPRLYWNEVPGVNSYEVTILDKGEPKIFPPLEVIGQTQVVYPGEPPLLPNVPYLLVVEADNGKSSLDEKTRGLGFTILASEEVERLQGYVKRLHNLDGLPDEAIIFAIARLYTAHELRAEAIELLEELIVQNPQNGAAQQLLGDLYFQIHLAQLAEAPYQQALRLNQNDPERIATIHLQLAKVYFALGDKDKAIHHAQLAYEGYKALTDTQRAAQAANLLDQMTKIK